jgi:NTE family protein
MFVEAAQKAEQLFSRDKKNALDEMGMFDIMGRTLDIMQKAILDSKMAGYSPDIIIGIPNDACGFYEFNKGYEMIELGKLVTQEQLAES